MRSIASADNKEYKSWRALHEKKYRDRQGCFLVEGDKLVREALEGQWVKTLILREDRKEELASLAEEAPETVLLKEDLFRRLAPTEHSQGVLAVSRKPALSREAFRDLYKKERKRPGRSHLLLLDEIQDPGNMGTLLRTAAAADFGGAVILKGSADVFAPKVVRSAAGALLHLPLYFAQGEEGRSPQEEAVALVRELGLRLTVTDPAGGSPYHRTELREKIALVIGNEGQGVSRALIEAADERIYIPMGRETESLNAAVAGGILMYQCIQEEMRWKDACKSESRRS